MQKPDEPRTTLDAFLQGLEVLEYFRVQTGLLSDKRILSLLKSLSAEPFTNRDARETLGVRRQASWKTLSLLAGAGLIEKRGHSYRVTLFARDFVLGLSTTLTGVLTGRSLTPTTPGSKEALRASLEGLEALYAKGRLGQADYSRYKTVVEEMFRAIR